MKLAGRSLSLEEDLTNEIWDDVKRLIKNKEDISLHVINKRVSIRSMDIPDAISSVTFESCEFVCPTEISGLNKGRGLSFENCRRGFLVGNVKVKNMTCRNFELYQSALISTLETLSPEINKCVFHTSIIDTKSLPTLLDSMFINKLKVISSDKNKQEETLAAQKEVADHLYFEGCVFHDHTEISINLKSKLSLSLIKCKIVKTNEEFYPRLTISDKSDIKDIIIKDSNLEKLTINCFMSSIENIHIENSILGRVDFSTIESDDDNAIYNIEVNNSELNGLSLRYKNIVHELRLINTLFKSPPQLFGSTISGGSLFPSRKYFLSRKGEHDASCYRTLRYFMESQRNRDMEGMFFSLEQQSLLNTKSSIHKLFSISNIYYLLSDYGTNYRRPLIIFIFSLPVFTLIYSLLNSKSISPNLPLDWVNITNSWIYTLKQTFQPFENIKSLETVTKGNLIHTIIESSVALANTLFSFLLLTLSGLAIRWRFKRG